MYGTFARKLMFQKQINFTAKDAREKMSELRGCERANFLSRVQNQL